ncbi:MAG: hypothetical protein ACRESK_00790, partial [Gammaproteobacteria bacterium]
MTHHYSSLLGRSPDPESATLRFERLIHDDGLRSNVEKMSEADLTVFIHLVSISTFLFRFLLRQPDAAALLTGAPALEAERLAAMADLHQLRLYKYQELLKITWMDLQGNSDYRQVLHHLSRLAENIISRCLQLVSARDKNPSQPQVPHY